MRVVIDTNVLVSGLLTPFGTCSEIVRMVASAELTLCFDARIMTEYREVLARPRFRFNQERVTALLEQIEQRGVPVAAAPLAEPLPDLDDEPFLAVALDGMAACLVTGNLSHFPPDRRTGVTILAPAEFLAVWRERQASR